jgi:hypothetical protein
MPVTLNLKKGIDLPVFQWLRFLPASSAAGACMCNDERGTDRFIYMLLGATSFWRYDTWTDSYQQLANPPTLTFAAGVAMTFDPSRGTAGYIWLFAPLNASPWCVFAYYDIATNTWTSRAVPSGLAAQWGTDTALSHTCSALYAAGNDDYIYLIGNNSATWYRYSISENAWTTMTPALPASAGVGCALVWTWGYNADRLYYLRGGGSASLYYFTISTSVWSADIPYVPKTETFTTGTSSAYDTLNRIYMQKDSTHRMYYYQLTEDKIYPAGMMPYASGTAIVGNGLVYVKTPDGAEYLYYRRQSGAEFWRMLIGWF